MAKFVLSLPLFVNDYAYKKLEKRFNVAHHLYNAVLGECEKRKQKYISSVFYIDAKEKYKLGFKKEAKVLYDDALKESGFFFRSASKYGFNNSIEQFAANIVRDSWLDEHLTSDIISTLAERAFEASKKTLKWIQSKGKFKKAKVKFKSFGRDHIYSVDAKTNKTPLRLKENNVIWNGLVLPLIIKDNDGKAKYEVSSAVPKGRIRLKRKWVRNKWNYFVDIVCEGTPFLKSKNKLGVGVVGVDVGPSSIAYVSDNISSLNSIFDKKLDTKLIRKLQRQIDRQRRLSNPNKFNNNGTINRSNKDKWIVSKRQKKNEKKIAELQRKISESRRNSHGIITNKIRSEGNILRVDKDSYKKWQESQYGKSIGNHAPGMLIELLKNKFETTGGEFNAINTFKSKSSQTCPNCGNIEKKGLKENKDSRSIRIHKCKCGFNYQRDLVSAIVNKFYNTETNAININESNKFIKDNKWVLQAGIDRLIQYVRECRISTSTSGNISELEHIASKDVESVNDDVVKTI